MGQLIAVIPKRVIGGCAYVSMVHIVEGIGAV